MSKTIWGNPLNTSSFIDDAYMAKNYPGIFISDKKLFFPNKQPKSDDELDSEENRTVIGLGVACWSIFDKGAHEHRLYCLYTEDFMGQFWSIRDNTVYSENWDFKRNVTIEDEEEGDKSYVYARFRWYTPRPVPMIKTYYVDGWPDDDFIINVLSKWLSKAPTTTFQRQPMCFITKQTDWIGNGLSWNFEGDIIAVKPGAWTQTFIDRKHLDDAHAFMLSANEFTVLLVSVDGMYGYNSHRELHSEPMIIDRKRYHALHIKWEAPYSFDIPAYAPPDGLPPDEAIYIDLKKYVDEYPSDAYECYWIFTRHGLYMYTESDDNEVDIDAIFAGYYVQDGDEYSAYVHEIPKNSEP